jgi:hypothetical protein
MPLGRWIAMNDNNDIAQLVISGNPSPEQIMEAYYALYDEFNLKHGTKGVSEALKDKLRAAKMLIKYIKTLDRFLEFEANILLDEIKTSQKTGISMMEEKGHIEETLGFWLDPERVTVDEYYAKKKQVLTKWQIQSKTTKSRMRGSLSR